MKSTEKYHTHGIMFHHFHDSYHPNSQGALSAAQFELMLDWLSERYNLVNADEYSYKLARKKLDAKDICLTFDDALLCQSDIAVPILKRKNIQAYFFIYSSPYTGNPDYLEIYRYFRTNNFQSIDHFYESFFNKVRDTFEKDYALGKLSYLDKGDYLNAFPFYTQNDKWFRYLRDYILGDSRYKEIMIMLMEECNFDQNMIIKKLWMSEKDLNRLIDDGHTVGLHSYSHPTTIHLLDKKAQENEYKRNYKHLSELLGKDLFSMSHPCGNYNEDTLDILRRLNITIGFRSSNSIKSIKSELEIPREDHANILRAMDR